MIKPATSAILATFLLLAPAASADHARPFQDQAYFKAAVVHEEGAPDGSGEVIVIETGLNFVLLTVIDDRTGNSWTGCTPAQFLEGAVHIENRLGYDTASAARGQQIILDNKKHIFHFSKSKALENIPMDAYDASDLKRARKFIRIHGIASLEDGASRSGVGADVAALNQTALACAVIEKGYSAYMPDRIPYVYAEPKGHSRHPHAP